MLWFSDRTWRLVALGAALALRFAALGRADLWTDEIQTLHAVSLPIDRMVAERLHAGHAPLYFLVESAWCAVVGTSQIALRLPSAIFGMLLLIPAWSLLRRLAGVSAAWWGTALLAFHPLFVELSREARMYSLLALVVFLAADGAAAALEGRRPGAWFWIAVAAGPFVHPTWGVAMLPVALWLVLERRAAPPEARAATRAALVGIAASLLALVAVMAFADPQHQELTRRPWPREFAVFALRLFAGSDLRLFHGVLACFAVVAIWGLWIVMGLAKAPPRARRFALWWAVFVPAASVVAGVLGSVPWGPARYVQMASAGFVILAAIGCASKPDPRNSRAPVLPLLALLTSVWPLCSLSAAWSEAAASLRSDPAPVVVDDESSRIVLAHYLGRDVSVGEPPPGAAQWRRATLVPEAGRREVRIVTETR